jgi:hypothetical protein
MAGVPIKKAKLLALGWIYSHLDCHMLRVRIHDITPGAMMPVLLHVRITGAITDQISHTASIWRFRPLGKPQCWPERILKLEDITENPDGCHDGRENRCQNQSRYSPVTISMN